MFRLIVLSTSFVALLASGAESQSLASIKPGTPIKLFAGGQSHRVDWVQLRSDSSAVVSENQQLHQITVSSIDSVFRFARRGSDAAWKAAILGAAAGAALFPIVVDCDGSSNCTRTRVIAGTEGAAFGSGVFALTGAIVGTITSGHWVVIYRRR